MSSLQRSDTPPLAHSTFRLPRQDAQDKPEREKRFTVVEVEQQIRKLSSEYKTILQSTASCSGTYDDRVSSTSATKKPTRKHASVKVAQEAPAKEIQVTELRNKTAELGDLLEEYEKYQQFSQKVRQEQKNLARQERVRSPSEEPLDSPRSVRIKPSLLIRIKRWLFGERIPIRRRSCPEISLRPPADDTAVDAGEMNRDVEEKMLSALMTELKKLEGTSTCVHDSYLTLEGRIFYAEKSALQDLSLDLEKLDKELRGKPMRPHLEKLENLLRMDGWKEPKADDPEEKFLANIYCGSLEKLHHGTILSGLCCLSREVLMAKHGTSPQEGDALPSSLTRTEYTQKMAHLQEEYPSFAAQMGEKASLPKIKDHGTATDGHPELPLKPLERKVQEILGQTPLASLPELRVLRERTKVLRERTKVLREEIAQILKRSWRRQSESFSETTDEEDVECDGSIRLSDISSSSYDEQEEFRLLGGMRLESRTRASHRQQRERERAMQQGEA